jgi:hypothetical protein
MLNRFYRSKAVSDGAIIWKCARLVSARRARFSVGTDMRLPYDKKNPAHRVREAKIGVNGVLYVCGVWARIVEKVSCLP